MNIIFQGRQLNFTQIPLKFHHHGIMNLFSAKNNKTLAETLENSRYSSLSLEAHHRYPNSLNKNLGKFLLELKLNGDNYYLHFLNEHGDKEFCDFSVDSTPLSRSKGIYSFVIGEDIMYFGRSHDPFERRVNQGYGHISPKNCFRDGQSTNCHINSLMARNIGSVSFHVLPLDKDLEIDRLEKLLINYYRPKWNVQF